MQLRLSDLDRHLSQQLAPLYVLHGEETLLTVEAGEAIRQAARRRGYLDREVLTVEPGFSWSQLVQASQSVSLFAEQKLLELRIPTGKPGKEGGEALAAFARKLPADTVTLIELPKLDKTTQNSKWFSALADAGQVLLAAPVNRTALPAWLTQRLARQQQQLDNDALQFLADRVEGNLLAAHQETQKLGLLYPAGRLTLEQVREAVANVARFDVFQLGEALLAGDAARFSRMLDGLRAEGEAPVLALWALTEEVRTLYKLGLGRQRGGNFGQLLKDNRVWGDKQRLMEPALNRVKASQLKAALARAARIDRLIKGIGAGDPWAEMQQLGFLLMPGAPRLPIVE